MPLITCDISYFQPVVTDAYPHQWLIFRCCDGDFADPNCDANATWADRATKAGKLIGWTAYVVYRPGKNQAVLNHLAGLPAGGHVMVDVESWGGQITGDHSAEVNQLAVAISQTHPGRVWVYGNKGDLATIDPGNTYPVVIASYGGVKPEHPNLIGWQYTDGNWNVPGKPNSSAPFGQCDHNELYVSADQALSGPAREITQPQPAPVEDGMYELLTIGTTRAVIAAGPGVWYHLEGTTPAERTKNVADAKSGPFWNGKVTNVSPAGALFWKNLYLSGKKA